MSAGCWAWRDGADLRWSARMGWRSVILTLNHVDFKSCHLTSVRMRGGVPRGVPPPQLAVYGSHVAGHLYKRPQLLPPFSSVAGVSIQECFRTKISFGTKASRTEQYSPSGVSCSLPFSGQKEQQPALPKPRSSQGRLPGCCYRCCCHCTPLHSAALPLSVLTVPRRFFLPSSLVKRS